MLSPLRPGPWGTAVKALRFAGLVPPKVKNPSHPPNRILVVNPTVFVGDTVMMMPLLDCLHEALPDAKIEVVTSASMASFVKRIPYLHDVYGLDIPASGIPIWKYYVRLYGLLRFAQVSLRNKAYDLCLVPRWGIDSNMSVYLGTMTSAPYLSGHDPDEEIGGQNPFERTWRLLTSVSHGGAGLPEAVRELRLLLASGVIDTLDVEAEKIRPIAALLKISAAISLKDLKAKMKIEDAPYVVLAPGASHPSRCWPPERFAAVADYIQGRLGLQILIVGGTADEPGGKEIERRLGNRVRSLIGKTSLAETVTLLSGSTLLLANDSGPAHIGSGLGIPTIVLNAYPSTSTQQLVNFLMRVHPLGPRVRVLQPEKNLSGCDDRCAAPTAHCILGLKVESVLREIEDFGFH
jgi:ADP-heptose:LPS heptosyltransferase